MASYVELIRQDVCHHRSCKDAFSWPSPVSRFVQSLDNEMRLPRWLQSGPVPYTNERVLDLLDHLRVSDDARRADLWDDIDRIIDGDLQQRLHVVFNTALADCARIRAVVDAENLTHTPYPKESFLAILVRNAILNANPGLSSLEDVPVALPRHFSGEVIPILNYMSKSFLASLIVSICEGMPVEQGGPDEHPPGDEEDDSSVESELFEHSPPTMSEFLEACERDETPEEAEEEQEESVLPPQFEAYFLARLPPATPPPTCHIPVLCMADEEQLPVLMSSLLYQRRVWRISDPMVGVEFSKYDTTIRLYVGWLDDDVCFDRVLPRVHLGEIGTPITLDLSSPSAALAVSRLLCGLEAHISGVRDTIRQSVGAVVSRTQSHSPLSWRIDTNLHEENHGSDQENDDIRDMIIQWAECQQNSGSEEMMPPQRKGDKIGLSGSATSTPVPQQASDTSPSSSFPSKEKTFSIPELREPHGHADSISTFCSRLSCSVFAATTEKDDYRVFRWMFDRRVVPQSIPSDMEFREEYSRMTGFIWPETWHGRDDLPSVDVALEQCVQELLEGVAALKARPNAVNCIPPKEFPVDLRILEQSFSAIFQASRRSREKREFRENVYEASWRHDLDRLLFDFFIRLIQSSKGDAACTLVDQSLAHLEDPLARPTLETTLRLPKSDNLQKSTRQQLQKSIQQLIFRQAADLDNWLISRGDSPDAFITEGLNVGYVVSQWSTWVGETNSETQAQTISKLGWFPSTGRCDALGRLLVELPSTPFENISNVQLAAHAAGKTGAGEGGGESKASSSRSRTRNKFRSQVQSSTKTSGSTLTVPDVATRTNGRCYTILSSPIPSSMPSLGGKQMASAESMDALAFKIHGLQIGPGVARLELPILTVEYKKASDNAMKGTNQLRMYLTASVKFLQAVGITNVPVYGVQTDGPIVVLPAAILRDDGFVYMFERLVERLDISTPLGAWHYATILCRLAQNHTKVLEKKFAEVRDNLITSLIGEGNQAEGWTMDDQMARLKAENRAKSPRRENMRQKT